MSDEQLEKLFCMPRDAEGQPKAPPHPIAMPTHEELFRRKLYLLGITEPEHVARQWAIECERLKRLHEQERTRG